VSEYVLGTTAHALTADAPLQVGVANFYSKGDGALYRTLDPPPQGSELEIWRVNDLSAIQQAVQAAGKTGAQIRDALAALTGNNRLDASAIRNLPQPTSGLAGLRTEQIALQDVVLANTDVELEPADQDPITVTHGDGDAELLTGISGNDFTVTAGLYLVTAEGALSANQLGIMDLDLRQASNDAVIFSLPEATFHGNNPVVEEDFNVSAFWHLGEDTQVNVFMERNRRNTGLADLTISFSRLASEPLEGQPDAFFTVFVSGGGSSENDGRTWATPVSTILDAMAVARTFTPPTAHRTIFCVEALGLGELVNNTATGNIANLIVDCRSGIFELCDITRKSNVTCRRLTGNAILGSGSQLDVWGSMGDTSATTATFVAGAHEGTLLKVRTMAGNVTPTFAGITGKVRVEIDDWKVADFEASMKTLLDTIPAALEVSGWVGKHNFGEAASAPTPGYAPVRVVRETAGPTGRRFRIGTADDVFVSDGTPDLNHWTDVATFEIDALRIGSALTGRMLIERHVSGVAFPSLLYGRLDSGNLVLTTDGTDTVDPDLTQFIGSSARMWVKDNAVVGVAPSQSPALTIHYPIDNYSETITADDQTDDLLVQFNFPDWDVDVASFIGDLTLQENTGFRATSGPAARVWNGKTRIRFNRVSKNHYNMTLGDGSSFGNANVKVEDFFKKSLHSINLNTGGSHTNQVALTGHTGIVVPYVPESQLVAEVSFSVETEDKGS
ncbi:MAG: hypothetical protein OXI50_13995, partial [Gammaproteobacteria bacterium]|nr:hypothetical protein [Gammaproteobacteria bacterium]